MWSAIARIFTKNEADSARESGEEKSGGGEEAQSMDRGEIRRTDLEMQDSYDTSQVGTCEINKNAYMLSLN